MAQALLVVHPVHAVSNYFVGAGVAGKGLAFVHVLDVVLQGFGYLVTPFVVVLLLLAAWGVAHRARGVGALLLQPIVAGYVVVPFLRAFGTADARLLGAITVLTAVCFITLIAHRHRRQHAPALVAAGGFPRSALWSSQPSEALASPAVRPVRALTGDGTGQARAGQDVPSRRRRRTQRWPRTLQQHPQQLLGHGCLRVADPSDPRGAPVESLFTGGGLRNDDVRLTGPADHLVLDVDQGRGLHRGPRHPRSAGQEDRRRPPRLTDFSGGGFILDNQDRIVFPARGGTLRILSTVDGLQDVDSIDVSTTLEPTTGHLRDARLGRALLVRGRWAPSA